jgi:hypothetical protein
MPTPSLLIVPARFKSGKLYSQLPTSGAGDFTVTRATNATRVNASGLIESVASGIPRLDYPIGGGCPALLVEPSGSNLVVQSQNWLASGWRSDATANVTTVSATTGTLDPLGTYTANAISPTSGSTSHLKVGSDSAISFTSGTVYTASAFFKQGVGNAGRYIQIAWPATRFAANTFANFDLELGTVALVTGSTVTADIENYGNGWYRCRCTNTCISTGTGANGISIALIETSGATRLPTFTGTTTDVLYGWGAQTETGSVATSYIPTTTAAVTRNADVVSVSGAVSGSIGQTQGTIYLDLTVLGKGSSSATRWVQIFGPSNNIGLAINSSNLFRSIVNTQSDTLLTAPLISSGVKVAWAYDATGTTCFINGTQYTLTTGGNQTMSSLTSISIDGSANTAFGFARIRAAALYNTRLTNAELAALTSP